MLDARDPPAKNVIVRDQPRNPTALPTASPSRTKKEVVAFCEAENLLLVADEVYQENVYAEGKSFTSFKKVMRDIVIEHRAGVAAVHELKGFGPCGLGTAGTWSSTGSTRR